jgi:hypothetical protein
MPVRTSVSLPDDLHAQWRRSGLTLPELVRRGLDEHTVTRRVTRAEARFAAVDQRLAAIEHRLAQVEASAASMLSYAELDDTADMLNDEEHEQLRAEQHRQDMNDRRALLLAKVPRAPGEPVVVDVAVAFGVSDQTARSWMKALASYGYGYARQLDRKEGTGQRYEWAIDEPAVEHALR